MSLFDFLTNLKGTILDVFQIGKDGPSLERVPFTQRMLLPKEMRWVPDPGDTPQSGIVQTDGSGNLILGSSVSSFPVKHILSGETVVIPERQEMAIHGRIKIEGCLKIDGCLVIRE